MTDFDRSPHLTGGQMQELGYRMDHAGLIAVGGKQGAGAALRDAVRP